VVHKPTKSKELCMRIKNLQSSQFEWLTGKFRTRHKIPFEAICDESASVDNDSVQSWIENIPNIVKKLRTAERVWSSNENGIYYNS
jgi:hypothetical protein